MTRLQWEELDTDLKQRIAATNPEAASWHTKEKEARDKIVDELLARGDALLATSEETNNQVTKWLERVNGRAEKELANPEERDADSFPQPPPKIREILEKYSKSKKQKKQQALLPRRFRVIRQEAQEREKQ